MRMARFMVSGTPLLAVALALSGCKAQPDFDERYDAANARIEKTAKEIDAQIAATDSPLASTSEAAR